MEDGPCVDGSPIRNGGFSDLCWTRGRLVGGHISTSTFAYDPDFNLQEQRSQENVPSGKHTRNYGKSPFYSWVNQLFLWPFSIAMFVYQRAMANDANYESLYSWLRNKKCATNPHLLDTDFLQGGILQKEIMLPKSLSLLPISLGNPLLP